MEGWREKGRKRRRRGNELRTYCRHLQVEDMGDIIRGKFVMPCVYGSEPTFTLYDFVTAPNTA